MSGDACLLELVPLTCSLLFGFVYALISSTCCRLKAVGESGGKGSKLGPGCLPVAGSCLSPRSPTGADGFVHTPRDTASGLDLGTGEGERKLQATLEGRGRGGCWVSAAAMASSGHTLTPSQRAGTWSPAFSAVPHWEPSLSCRTRGGSNSSTLTFEGRFRCNISFAHFIVIGATLLPGETLAQDGVGWGGAKRGIGFLLQL